MHRVEHSGPWEFDGDIKLAFSRSAAPSKVYCWTGKPEPLTDARTSRRVSIRMEDLAMNFYTWKATANETA